MYLNLKAASASVDREMEERRLICIEANVIVRFMGNLGTDNNFKVNGMELGNSDKRVRYGFRISTEASKMYVAEAII